MPTIAFALGLQKPDKRRAGIFAGAQRYTQQQGWKSVVDEFPLQGIKPVSVVPQPYDLILAEVTQPLAKRASLCDIPIVNVWPDSPVCDFVPSVLVDYAAAGQIRAEHLIELGVHHFAALGFQDKKSDAIEIKALQKLLREVGYSCHAQWIPSNYNDSPAKWRRSEQLIEQWLQQLTPPVGIFVSSEVLARIVMQMCMTRGWRIPQDVAIIAGSNDISLCESPSPTLSSIEMGYERVGYEAARLAGRLLEARFGAKPITGKALQPRIAPVGLVPRESTDFLTVPDESVARALDFIAANCHLPVSPREVAQAVFTELRTLQRRFDEHLGRTIAAEIRRVRVENAKRELVKSRRQLSEIAIKVGFGSSMRMYEVFRRDLGVTPSEYRKHRS